MTRIEQFAAAALAGTLAYSGPGNQTAPMKVYVEGAWHAADLMEAEAMRRECADARPHAPDPDMRDKWLDLAKQIVRPTGPF